MQLLLTMSINYSVLLTVIITANTYGVFSKITIVAIHITTNKGFIYLMLDIIMSHLLKWEYVENRDHDPHIQYQKNVFQKIKFNKHCCLLLILIVFLQIKLKFSYTLSSQEKISIISLVFNFSGDIFILFQYNSLYIHMQDNIAWARN